MVFSPGVAADVGAVGNPHASLEGFRKRFAFHRDQVGPDPAPSLRDVHADVDGRAPVDVLLHHAIDQVVGETVAVLDAVDLRGERRIDAVPCHGVRRDLATEAVGLVDHCLQLGAGEVHPGPQGPFGIVRLVVLAIGIELDPVGAVLHLLADGFSDGVGAVHDLHAFRQVLQLPGVAEQRVRAGRRERARGDEHPRPGDHTAGDGRLDIDVGVHRALGLQVADGGEAVHHGGAHRGGGAQGAVRDALLEELLVVVGRGDIALEEDVGMGVDQAGEEPGLAEIDHANSRRLELGGGPDLRDALSFHEDGELVPGRARVAVDQMRGFDEHALRRPRRRRRLAQGLGEEEDERDQHGAGTVSRRHAGAQRWPATALPRMGTISRSCRCRSRLRSFHRRRRAAPSTNRPCWQ